jgi:hypothetical protein
VAQGVGPEFKLQYYKKRKKKKMARHNKIGDENGLLKRISMKCRGS